MKKLLPVIFLLLLAPAFVCAANSLDEANNVRNNMSNPDGSADYIQQQYLNGSNASGVRSTTANQPASLPNSSINNPSGTSNVSINDVAALNATQMDDGREMLQAEQDLRNSRERSLIGYCTTVLTITVALVALWSVLKATPISGYFALAVTLAVLTMVTIGFVKILKTYPDGMNPSGGVKTVCSIMMAAALASLFVPFGGIGSTIAYLAVGFGFIFGGNKLAKSLVSKPSTSTTSAPQETAADIEAKYNQYKGGN
ncbi:MAG: hypothetical protein FWF35_00600 [Elusimicrobia bacterium]|nr:hypothetical protein [Elusimicrobiota bacterium]